MARNKKRPKSKSKSKPWKALPPFVYVQERKVTDLCTDLCFAFDTEPSGCLGYVDGELEHGPGGCVGVYKLVSVVQIAEPEPVECVQTVIADENEVAVCNTDWAGKGRDD